ncbi:hypothetical protein MHK_006965 [Candidatus Magnetomorum sp. HK-1]|nr:hypothetical protein MHK_006965 [Candidatus Magnetomorum sp. HK-1]
MKKLRPISPFLYSFFWDCDPEKIDVVAHSSFIMHRIMERGTYAAMRWLQQTYTDDQRCSFLEQKGYRVLPLRELNYWLLMSGVKDKRREILLDKSRKQNNVWQKRNSY